MKQYLLLTTLFFVCYVAHAQKLTQTIRGKVIDAESQTPLIGANVYIVDSDPLLGAATDVDGNFRIEKVPVGRHNIRITYLGYEDGYISELLVGSGKEIVLTIKLTEAITLTEAVTITAEPEKGEALNDMAVVSARMFTVEETKRYAASINDPARMAMNFAGVAANSDLQNDIVIRGNSPRGLLWRIEGIEVPNPNHFASTGSSGGGISILSANMLANSDFFTGAFPAEYGNALSGVFDIKLRNGNNEQREYALQAGLLGVDFAFEGPFSKNYNGSYLVNYRYSTLAIFDVLGIDVVGDAVPNFQDLSFKFKLPTKKFGSFSIWGLGGKSSQAETTNDYKYDYRSDMGATGVSHTFFLNKKTFIESVVSFSASRGSYIEDQFDDPSLPQLVYQDHLVNRSFRVSSMLNRKFNAKNTLRAGIIFSNLSFNLFSEGEDAGEIKRYIDNQGASQLYQSYA
ncbi:MAG: carboxypeptidase-like regulatory domain-containing protein, partial [Flammeovirgaceae bacterium]